MTDRTCEVCGGPIPEDYEKFDPEAPVFADGYVYHLSCEDAVFDEVIQEV